MCGRYAASKDQDQLVEEFDIELVATDEPTRGVLRAPQDPPAGAPDWNMAPTKSAPVVLTRRPRMGHPHSPQQHPQATQPDAASVPESAAVRQLRLLTWGLVPSWAKDVKVGSRMINVRVESVREKASWARIASARRCLVPADGWYEWQRSPTAIDAKGRPRRQPFFVHRVDGQPLAFGGIYEFWRDPAVPDADDPAAWLVSFAILTAPAEPGLDRIHERAPLVLDREDWRAWLDPELTDLGGIPALLEPGPPGRFTAYPVTTAVNATARNGPQLLVPADRDDLHGVLDPMSGEVIGA